MIFQKFKANFSNVMRFTKMLLFMTDPFAFEQVILAFLSK